MIGFQEVLPSPRVDIKSLNTFLRHPVILVSKVLYSHDNLIQLVRQDIDFQMTSLLKVRIWNEVSVNVVDNLLVGLKRGIGGFVGFILQLDKAFPLGEPRNFTIRKTLSNDGCFLSFSGLIEEVWLQFHLMMNVGKQRVIVLKHSGQRRVEIFWHGVVLGEENFHGLLKSSLHGSLH